MILSNVDDIAKILIKNTLSISERKSNWCITDKKQMRNATSLYGPYLDEVLNKIQTELKGFLLVFEITTEEENVNMSLSGTTILTSQMFRINFTCYNDNTLKCFSQMTDYKNILLTEDMRLMFEDDAIFIKDCSNVQVVNEFINNKIWSTVRMTMTIAAEMQTTITSGNTYNSISEINIKEV